MATYSALYPLWKQSRLSQSPSIDMSADTIKLGLVNLSTDYTYSAAHQYVSSVTRYASTTDQTLTSKTVTDGVFACANATFAAVNVSGSKPVQALILYKSTGTDSTSPLIALIVLPLSVLPDGRDIIVSALSGLIVL